MSGPYGLPQPPAVLLSWSDADGAWLATPIVSADGEPITVRGPSTCPGDTPADALQMLLTRRLCFLADNDAPATIVAIEAEAAA